MFTEQLTHWDNSDFARVIHEQIQKDYPDVSTIKTSKNGLTAVFVTKKYLNDVEFLVKENCKIKDKVYKK